MRSVRVYFTSDLHGYFPQADFQKGENTLIIDGGDIIQGSPFAQYCRRVLGDFSAIAEIINERGYDFVTVGNHDFNYGMDALDSYLGNLKAHCLCENLKVGDKTAFPYSIKVLENGMKVGIVGIVTEFVNVWEKPENLAGVRITDPFEAAKEALSKIKDEADLSICVYHGGFERDLDTGCLLSETKENIGCKICEELEFDILLTGHQHMAISGRYYHNTYLIQVPENGKAYACLDIGETIKSSLNYPESDDFKYIPQEMQSDVQAWLDEHAGQLPSALVVADRAEMALGGSPLADFFNQIQLKYSDAQLSVTSLANDAKGLPKNIKRRDLFAAYPYPNTFFVLEITGKQLKEALERSAEYLTYDSVGQLVISEEFLKPKVEHYNFDFYAGVEFEVDYHKPKGARILSLTYDGREIFDYDKFTICVNNYRASGAGGYFMYPGCAVVKEINVEMTDMLLDYFSAQRHT